MEILRSYVYRFQLDFTGSLKDLNQSLQGLSKHLVEITIYENNGWDLGFQGFKLGFLHMHPRFQISSKILAWISASGAKILACFGPLIPVNCPIAEVSSLKILGFMFDSSFT